VLTPTKDGVVQAPISYAATVTSVVLSGLVVKSSYTFTVAAVERKFEKELALLPPKMREVFELSRKSYLTHREIAEKMEISDHTVKKQINNALKILRLRIGIFLLFFLVLLFYVFLYK